MMLRRFQVACDARSLAPKSTQLCPEAPTHRNAQQAREVAAEAGWHVSGNYAICPEHWDAGIRWADVRPTKGAAS